MGLLKIPYSLDTSRLVIRRLIKEDLQPFYSFMQDPEATRYLLFNAEDKTYDAVTDLLNTTIHQYDKPDQIFAMAIAVKDDGRYIGSLGLQSLNGGKAVEIFYTIIPDHWGKGYAIEAGEEFLKYIFTQLDVDEVIAFCNKKHQASIRVAKHLGMNNTGEVKHEGQNGYKYTMTKKDYLAKEARDSG